ncbi:hypothetical protein Esi_0013_0148 [Ectocarpus siliculosus]|uniref:Uncharacterized protein n=1 Tax=Ectocarpus siliculosus TaxID=2880 RepID=D8LEC9_ECTSI|nr:hypothetical protein Esi_0013_0148 [Ectocarpus siliculosus]|eukprot:CBN74214.1 hypothetical protein Esi_0013_0148 [Ectocarpus siliculosus]
MVRSANVGSKIAGMFSRAKVLLPGYRRAAKELAERQQLGLEFAAYKWKMAVGGVAFTVLILILVLSMVILLRWWGKRQADRESALVHTVEESRAETATANEKTMLIEAQRDLQRLGMLFLNGAIIKEEEKTKKAERDLATCRAKYDVRATL